MHFSGLHLLLDPDASNLASSGGDACPENGDLWHASGLVLLQQARNSSNGLRSVADIEGK